MARKILKKQGFGRVGGSRRPTTMQWSVVTVS